jgi:hypothetical protein
VTVKRFCKTNGRATVSGAVTITNDVDLSRCSKPCAEVLIEELYRFRILRLRARGGVR